MNRKDSLKDWFKDLPPEQAPEGFSGRVMQGVMSEWSLNPYKYQPIISKKTWWVMGIMALAITGILLSLHSSVSSEGASSSSAFYGIDFKGLFSLFGALFNNLNNISPAVAIGALAIIALWFFDQLFTRAVKH